MNIVTLAATGHKYNSEAAPITRLSCVCFIAKKMSFTNRFIIVVGEESKNKLQACGARWGGRGEDRTLL